jgi:hypothetical protein
MGSFWLEYEQNGNVQTFPFKDGNVTIGREQTCDFVLDHPTVSRQHALIVDDGGGQFRLVVLSQGGLTAVDGEKLQEEAALYDGSELYFGKLAFRFRSEQAPARPHEQSGGRPAAGSGGHAGSTPGRRGSQAGGSSRQSAGQDSDRQPQSQPGAGRPAGQGAGAGGPSRPQSSQSNETSARDSSANASDSSPMSTGSGSPDSSDSQGSKTSSTANTSSRAGVKSWDEIAESAEVDEDDEESVDPSSSLADNIGSGGVGGDDQEGAIEETDPKVALGGLIGIGLFMAYFFWPSGGPGPKSNNDPLEETDPAEMVQVECLSDKECIKKAKSAYALGQENLDKQDSEVGNLFGAYRRFLEAQQYLEQAERDQNPSKLSDLQPNIDKAREALDEIFRNYQVKYRTAEKNSQPREMADALKTIQRYFPDKNAPEYKWAEDRILNMKERGKYPAGY